MKRFILAISTFLLLAATDDCTPAMKSVQEIEAEALSFANKMTDHVKGVECMNIDSDRDGYVTCTVFEKDREPFSIQCAARKDWNGCKTTVPKIQVQQQ